jgi:MFS family permease
MVSANPHDSEIIHTEACIPSMISEKPSKPIKYAKRDWKQYVTPDFKPMINIVFWNSLGFFFYGFVIRFATHQILAVGGFGMGLIFASQTIGGLISAPIVAIITDRVSKKKLILVGSFGRGLSYIIMYLGVCFLNPYLFTIGTFILGFSVGFFWTPMSALISQKTYKMVRSTAFGQQAGAIGKGNLVGSVFTMIFFGLTSYLIPDVPWILYFPLLIYCGFNIYAGIRFNKNVDEKFTYEEYISLQQSDFAKNVYQSIVSDNNKAEETKNKFNELKQNSKSKTLFNHLPHGLVFGFLLLMITFFTASINQSLAGPFLQAYLTDTFFGASTSIMIGFLVMLIYWPSEVISQLLAPKLGKFGDKIPPIRALIFISGTGALFTWLLINSGNEYIFGAIMLFDTTFAWGNMLVLQNLMSRLSKSNRGKIFGTRQWVSLLGAVIGPILGGYLFDLSKSAPFKVSIFIELSLIPLYFVSIKLLQPHMEEKIQLNKNKNSL